MKNGLDPKADSRKELGRRLFYDCVRRWVPKERLRQSRALLLLGDNTRELPYLDTLFSRSQIVCVERNLQNYLTLGGRRLGIALYYESLSSFLDWAIPQGFDFSVMNLDVYGTYVGQLQDTFGSVLSLAQRCPDHAIGFTSTVGRDSKLLCEALVSLALISGYAPGRVASIFEKRSAQFEHVGEFDNCPNLVLRDFMWLRDLLEYAVALSAKRLGAGKLYERFSYMTQRMACSIIDRIRQAKKSSFPLSHFMDWVSDVTGACRAFGELQLAVPVAFGLRQLVNFIYHSTPPWLVRQYFVRFENYETPIPLGQAVEQLLSVYEGSFFQYATRGGQATQLPRLLVRGGSDISLSLPKRFRTFSPRDVVCLSRLPKVEVLERRTPMAASKVSSNHAPKPGKLVLVTSEGKLTKYGCVVARELFEEGKDSKEIAGLLKCRETSARAVLAHMNR